MLVKEQLAMISEVFWRDSIQAWDLVAKSKEVYKYYN